IGGDGEEEDTEEENRSVVGYLEVIEVMSRGASRPDPRPLARRDIREGETTIGRKSDQDITIYHPSVSEAHAVIDVLDMGEAGGGLRTTVKDARSTNGTFIVNTSGGGRTKLVPRKATLLPTEASLVQFGLVVCKVAVGSTLPSPRREDGAAQGAALGSDQGQGIGDAAGVGMGEGEDNAFDLETQPHPRVMEGVGCFDAAMALSSGATAGSSRPDDVGGAEDVGGGESNPGSSADVKD
ncbi:unnamed protein product, partial [Discosporangium mesarthrocarpum]